MSVWELWDDEKWLAFDFETTGSKPEYALQPWRSSADFRATSLVTFHVGSGVPLIGGKLEPSVEDMRDMLELAIDTQRTIVGWHTPFDIMVLLHYGLEGLVKQAKWADGRLMWRQHFIEPEYEMSGHKRKSYGLKAMVAEMFPDHAGYEQGIDFHDESPEGRQKLWNYNVKDVLFTFKGAKKFWNRMTVRQRQVCLVESHTIPHVAIANYRGLPVDMLTARELQQSLTDDAAKALGLLAPLGVTEAVVRSPKQLATLMFDQWGMKVLKENVSKKTGKTTRSTDKEVLHELALDGDPRAKTLREYREALNNGTKFAKAPIESAIYNGDGRTRPQAMVFGTYSGRLTYSSSQNGKGPSEKTGKDVNVTLPTGFAIHQEKREKHFRAVIPAPVGYTLVEFDASGQEFRWMAIASRDGTMLSLCHPGEDPHSYMAAEISGMGYRDTIFRVAAEDKAAIDERLLGKVTNLSLQYRTSPPKLRSVARVQYNIPMELPQAKVIHKTYQKTYPMVPVYWNRQIMQTKANGYVETFAGRRVQVVGDWSHDGWQMGSTAINYRIQGTGADQKYLAMACLGDTISLCDAYFAWDLHDGLYFFVPDAKVDLFAARGKAVLDKLPYTQVWGFTPPIPLPWDCKTGPSWGQLHNWEPK